uniref:Uncharacterized protein n=1 Tax=Arundo donax TaxID=35708 RepID=A0A0A8XN01_ARUDO
MSSSVRRLLQVIQVHMEASLCLAVLQRRYYLHWTSICSLQLKNCKPETYTTTCGHFVIYFEVSPKDIC